MTVPLRLLPFTMPSPHREAVARIYREALGLDWEAEEPGVLHYARRYPDFYGLLALLGDEVVGIGWGTRTGPGEWLFERVAARCGADHPALQDCWLLNVLAVLPAHQAKGIGTALHDALLARQPCPRAIVSTGAANEGARSFYERLGWRAFEPECLIDAPARQFVVLRREVR